MSREIKFRGIGKSTLQFVYGNLIQTGTDTFILASDCSIGDWEPEYHSSGMGCGLEDRNIRDRYDAMQHGWDCAVERFTENLPEFIEVIPETVGQFTEMLDENDKELSAGDKGNFLLKGLGEGPAEVRYFDGGFWLVVEGQSQPLPLHEYEYRADITFTITGTIHDHLLKP